MRGTPGFYPATEKEGCERKGLSKRSCVARQDGSADGRKEERGNFKGNSLSKTWAGMA